MSYFELTAWMDGRDDMPLYSYVLEASDEEDARRQARIPQWREPVTVPFHWTCRRVTMGKDNTKELLDEAVRLLAQWDLSTRPYSPEPPPRDDTAAFLAKVRAANLTPPHPAR